MPGAWRGLGANCPDWFPSVFFTLSASSWQATRVAVAPNRALLCSPPVVSAAADAGAWRICGALTTPQRYASPEADYTRRECLLICGYSSYWRRKYRISPKPVCAPQDMHYSQCRTGPVPLQKCEAATKLQAGLGTCFSSSMWQKAFLRAGPCAQPRAVIKLQAACTCRCWHLLWGQQPGSKPCKLKNLAMLHRL